ncbi:EAL domain-containing protein [Pseudomarimonas arenosa]|uniref:EAL domain-containing protein n=1 Tax=Pseudomarimonas arenosa TaxID=2774145 RepID=A0AAW3ZL42_9GAMM|nr:EAL domain-containing protein [Pseudomarimonas arenosa]MBD8526756.1 EAL domain-containing protein [Pseudomarimonas arenosa]
MTLNLASLVYLLLAGMLLQASLSYLMLGVRAGHDRRKVLIAAVSLCAALLLVGSVWRDGAGSIESMGQALRFNVAVIALGCVALVWFARAYAGFRSVLFPWLYTLAGAMLIIIDLSRPMGITFEQIDSLRELSVPWGPPVRVPVGQPGLWLWPATIWGLIGLVYLVYASFSAWYRYRQSTALAIMLLTLALPVSLLHDVLARTDNRPTLVIGPVALAVLVLAFGIVFGLELGRQRARVREEVDAARRRADDQRAAILRLLTIEAVQQADLPGVLKAMTRELATTLSVERVGVWLYSEDGTRLQCRSLYHLGGQRWLETPVLRVDDYPKYFAALNQNGRISIEDTSEADELSEMWQGYLRPLGIGALLDSGINLGGRWIGVVCLEHVGSSRAWQADEQAFVGTAAAMVAELVADAERARTERAIRSIAAGVANSPQDRFFLQIVRNLAELFEAEIAYVGVLDGDRQRVTTLACWLDGKAQDNFSYDLAGTPCERTLTDGGCLYSSGVCIRFPDDTMLQEMQAEGYVAAPFFDADGGNLGLVGVIKRTPLDVNDNTSGILNIFAARCGAEIRRQRSEEHVRQLAFIDYLTGLATRARMYEYLNGLLDKLRNSGESAALLLLDLDHFKTINDALSHDIGDDVLRSVGRRLQSAVEQDVLVARLGGDEFALVKRSRSRMRKQAEREALELAQRLLATLEEPLFVGERSFNLGASLGLVVFPDNGENTRDLFRHAEVALYRAKSLGRGRLQMYLPTLQTAAANRLKLEEGLRRALAEAQLELYFQPKVDATARVVGAEALLRWSHPELGSVSPADFIPVAEETGIIISIGRWVLDKTMESIAKWQRNAVPFEGSLSVNISAWQLAQPDFAEMVSDCARFHAVEPGRITLEVTETAVLQDMRDVVQKLKQLREQGFRVSLDDFGTGYSSLSHLRDLPLDEIKIDRAFVIEVEDETAHPLVESMIAIGGHMNLDVVAEGVDSEVKRERLIRMGCRQFQGYLISRPLPEQAFLWWLADRAASLRLSG